MDEEFEVMKKKLFQLQLKAERLERDLEEFIKHVSSLLEKPKKDKSAS